MLQFTLKLSKKWQKIGKKCQIRGADCEHSYSTVKICNKAVYRACRSEVGAFLIFFASRIMQRSLFMKYSIYLLLILLPIQGIIAQTNNNYSNLNRINSYCNNITPQNRQLARLAGIDLDQECRNLKNSTVELNQNTNPQAIKQRTQRNPDTINYFQKKQRTNIPFKNNIYTDIDAYTNTYTYTDTYTDTYTYDTENFENTIEDTEDILQPFGYELFSGEPSNFINTDKIPVPSQYILGPGDTIKVFLFGKNKQEHTLPIGRDGKLIFPELGSITLGGLTFDRGRELLIKKITKQLIGVEASVTIEKFRSIQVYVLGEAYKPGSYTVSALSNVANALIASGGIRQFASLRNILLKRKGTVVANLDMYELLLEGNIKNDARLQDGDVIFIPTVGKQIAISGAVVRPAIYEIKNEKTVAQAINLAGGLHSKAYAPSTKITSNNSKGFTTVKEINLNSKQGKNTKINAGDFIEIATIVEEVSGAVKLTGHIFRERQIQWQRGMRVADLLNKEKLFPENLNLEFAVLARKQGPAKQIKLLPVSLKDLWNAKPPASSNLLLQTNDELILLNTTSNKARQFKSILKQITSYKVNKQLARKLSITGEVQFEGEYPYIENIAITDFVENLPGFTTESYIQSAIVLRRKDRSSRYIPYYIDLITQFNATEPKFKLQPSDEIYIFNKNNREFLDAITTKLNKDSKLLAPAHTVKIYGQVRHPNSYPLTKNMTIGQLIKLAGGFTERAFQFEMNLIRSSIETTNKIQSVVKSEMNLPINAENLNYRLYAKDILSIKKIPQYDDSLSVDVLGEVTFPGEYVLFKGDSLFKLILKAGGITENGDLRAVNFTRSALIEIAKEASEELETDIQQQLSQKTLSDGSIDSQEIKNVNELSQVIVGEGGDKNNQKSNIEKKGRLVVNLPQIYLEYKRLGITSIAELNTYKKANPNFIKTVSDVLLADGDKINIPGIRNEVFVVGEVHRETSHAFDNNLSHRKYIKLSGGFTKAADKRRTYIIRANGSTDKLFVKNIFGLYTRKIKVQPGDIIFVPFDADKQKTLNIISEVSRVIYQFLLSVVALRNLGI